MVVVASKTAVVGRHGVEADVLAQVVEAVFAHLAGHASDAGLDRHAVTHFEVLHVGSNFDYSGRRLVAGDQWLVDHPLI